MFSQDEQSCNCSDPQPELEVEKDNIGIVYTVRCLNCGVVVEQWEKDV